MKISLTFRDLTHPQINNSYQKLSNLISISETLLDEKLLNPLTDFGSISAAGTKSTEHKTVDTMYISSSMFADLDDTKLTSVNHRAAVFYYRGVTAGRILNNLQKYDKFNEIDSSNIKQVFLLCGTNDADLTLFILNVQKIAILTLK